MKNRIVLAALAALTLFSGVAFAGGYMRSDRLAWKFPANVTSAPYTQATKALAAGGTDTTIWVGTEGWYVPETPAADSVVVGRFIVFIDSTAAYAPAQTTITAVIDGAASPQAGGLPNVNYLSVSYTITPTTGQKLISIPIFANATNSANGAGTGGGWDGLAPFIRLRISTSAAINAAGVAVQRMFPN